MADCVQELLDDYCVNPKSTSKAQLTGVLSRSYERLPSDAHRLMFLDAALLLRGRPPAQLTALWEGQLLLDASLGDNKWPSEGLPARGSGESKGAWRARQQTAAPVKAAKLLADLEKLILVRSEPYDSTPHGNQSLR